ncbi:MAG: hypothetical protein JNL83_07860 [Myxococcales bacterium]|nr:hypothetical protein [Myxococcales bacterium]
MRSSLLLVLVASTAFAGEFAETIPRADREAIVKAIQANLPPVDKAAVRACQPLLDEYNKAPDQSADKAFEAAGCLVKAGSLGAGIQTYKLYERYGKDALKRKETLRALATSYEMAGYFSEAAEAGERYAKMFATEKDAKERLVRAICIRRQLGDDREAKAAGMYLQRQFRTKPDAALCATVRPIAMPATKP